MYHPYIPALTLATAHHIYHFNLYTKKRRRFVGIILCWVVNWRHLCALLLGSGLICVQLWVSYWINCKKNFWIIENLKSHSRLVNQSIFGLFRKRMSYARSIHRTISLQFFFSHREAKQTTNSFVSSLKIATVVNEILSRSIYSINKKLNTANTSSETQQRHSVCEGRVLETSVSSHFYSYVMLSAALELDLSGNLAAFNISGWRVNWLLPSESDYVTFFDKPSPMIYHVYFFALAAIKVSFSECLQSCVSESGRWEASSASHFLSAAKPFTQNNIFSSQLACCRLSGSSESVSVYVCRTWDIMCWTRQSRASESSRVFSRCRYERKLHSYLVYDDANERTINRGRMKIIFIDSKVVGERKARFSRQLARCSGAIR